MSSITAWPISNTTLSLPINSTLLFIFYLVDHAMHGKRIYDSLLSTRKYAGVLIYRL